MPRSRKETETLRSNASVLGHAPSANTGTRKLTLENRERLQIAGSPLEHLDLRKLPRLDPDNEPKHAMGTAHRVRCTCSLECDSCRRQTPAVRSAHRMHARGG